MLILCFLLTGNYYHFTSHLIFLSFLHSKSQVISVSLQIILINLDCALLIVLTIFDYFLQSYMKHHSAFISVHYEKFYWYHSLMNFNLTQYSLMDF